jgi:creatinine amidohydrolase
MGLSEEGSQILWRSFIVLRMNFKKLALAICALSAIGLCMGRPTCAEAAPSVFAGTLADMTYPELEEATRSGAVALWALGVIEEHGPHLPLATDVYVPTAQLLQVQHNLEEKKIKSVIVPPFYWGVNRVTGSFPGSIDIRPEVMTELMTDVFRSLEKAGFKHVFCITGHYDAAHSRAIIDAVRRANRALGINVYYVVPKPLAERVGLKSGDAGFILVDTPAEAAPAHPDLHAGEAETSMLLSIAPDLARTEIIPSLEPTDLTPKDVETWRKGYENAKKITPRGYLGDPAKANAASGAIRIERQAAAFAEAIAGSVR